jgi:hypothetical protein
MTSRSTPIVASNFRFLMVKLYSRSDLMTRSSVHSRMTGSSESHA